MLNLQSNKDNDRPYTLIEKYTYRVHLINYAKDFYSAARLQ